MQQSIADPNHVLCEPRITRTTMVKTPHRHTVGGSPLGATGRVSDARFPTNAWGQHGSHALIAPNFRGSAASTHLRPGKGPDERLRSPFSASPPVQVWPLRGQEKGPHWFSPLCGLCQESLAFSLQNPSFLEKPCSCRRNPLCFQNIASAVSL